MVPVESWSVLKITSPTKTWVTSQTSGVPFQGEGWVKGIFMKPNIVRPCAFFFLVSWWNFSNIDKEKWMFRAIIHWFGCKIDLVHLLDIISRSIFALPSKLYVKLLKNHGEKIYSKWFFLFLKSEWPWWSWERNDFCLQCNT